MDSDPCPKAASEARFTLTLEVAFTKDKTSDLPPP
jgi:hypothetical protein